MPNIGFFVWTFIGLLFIMLGLPFAKGFVPPNRWAGFRLPVLRQNKELWYAANRVMGIDFIIAGIAVVVLSLVTTLIVSDLSLAYQLNRGAVLLALGAVALHCFWSYARMRS